MPTFTFTSRIDAPAETVFAWHTRPGAVLRLTPPWTDVGLDLHEGIQDGDRAVLRMKAGPLRRTWVAEHHDYLEGRQFCDTQVRGPFRRWTHTHRMEPDATHPDACTLTDHIDYALPLGKLSQALVGSAVYRQLTQAFAYRHRITQQDLALHRRYNPGGQSLRIAVSGSSGLIGTNLCSFLTTGGHRVLRLLRARPTQADEVYWNPVTGEIEAEKLEHLDAVIHLAGASVFALRWTDAKKRLIRDSRVDGTKLLSETLARLHHPPKVLLSASGVHYYGLQGATVLTETAPPGDRSFLTSVTHAWEAATRPAADAGIRTVRLRIGVVLSPQGGALRTMLLPFRLGLGGRVGPKDQYFSWISLDDTLGALYHLLMTDADGPFNLTAPHPVTMATYTRTLARVLRRPALFSVPSSLVRLAAGEVADEVLFSSSRVLPERLQQSGFAFSYPDLENALRHLLGKVVSNTH